MDDGSRLFLVSKTHRGRALVLGGGFTGLLAARMLTAHFEEVVVLERDSYPSRPIPRNGTPQDRHVHLLLLRGRQILERFFPGIGEELVRHGACRLDASRSLSVLNYHGWAVRYPSEMEVLTFTRPLLDWCMRRRIVSHRRVRIIENCYVTGLKSTEDTIAAVRCRPSSCHTGDFVIDATGRFSRTPDWLSELGFGHSNERVVDPQLGYSTCLLERSSDLDGDAQAFVVLGKPPGMTRGGVLLPVENEQWVATLVGISGDYPPTDPAEFVEFAMTLRSPAIHDIIKNEAFVTPVSGFRATKNRRRDFAGMVRWPRRFVVLGDAGCALNPIYAQGMTVGALGVSALDVALRRSSVDKAGQRFQRALSRIHRVPWLFATAEDRRWPGTDGYGVGFTGRLLHRYMYGILAAATDEPAVDETLARVLHMIDSPTKLFYPHVAWPALAHSMRREES